MQSIFSIPLKGLKEGNHLYDFKIDSNFFASFEKSEIHEAELKAVVSLNKSPSHIELRIEITGTVILICDRCLDPYTQGISTDNRILVKFGEKWEEVDDEVIIIPFGESEFELDQLIYEFAHLGLPLKKMHPDDEFGNSTCNPDMLSKLKQHLVNRSGNVDPRWKELEQLRNINN
ncbi:MAG: DUF177 domain-containing protein [Bacteroidales bacterium]|nr:DUF177 domain-containing protein [Bacteroidales bacterium]